MVSANISTLPVSAKQKPNARHVVGAVFERWCPKVDVDLYTGWERYDLWQPIVINVTEVYLKVVSTVGHKIAFAWLSFSVNSSRSSSCAYVEHAQ